jgi:cobalt-zinc-cadmium efflux system protein
MDKKQITSTKAVPTSLLLNTLLTIVEIIAGTLSGSLSLIADGFRNLTDSLLLTVSYIAERLSRRKADDLRTWGYGRIKIIASLVNTGIILTIALIIGYEAISRFGDPKHIQGTIVMLVAGLSVAVNAGVALLLKGQRADINIRTAYTGLYFGAISSASVLLSGLLITVFHWYWVDNITGIIISVLLLYATAQLAREAIHVLLEGVPDDINMQSVKSKLLAIRLVVGVEELHAWTLEHDSLAFSCHLKVLSSDFANSHSVLDEARHILAQDFGFKHITIEIDSA